MIDRTTIEQLKILLKAQPFVPIRLYTADGEWYWIEHPEWVLIPPVDRPRTIYLALRDGRVNHIAARYITNVQTKEEDVEEVA